MSGNYDWPPASQRFRRRRPNDRPHQPERPNGNRLQHLRDLLNSERNRNTSVHALETLNQELEEFRSGRTRDQYTSDQTRAFVDGQIGQLHRERIADLTHGARPGLGFQRLVAAMNHDQSASDLSRSINRASRSRVMRGGSRSGRGRRTRDSILDQPVPRIDSPSAMLLEPDEDRQTDRWRPKRRKLDSDDSREGLQTFRYGQYGQVVPGTLQMELSSCDGGTYEPVCESSWPENILRNDSSVYCTKSDRCNLVLKHRGEMPFCLKKLVIKAPKSGYDAPIQAGMVFVSMSSDELLSRTAQYQIQYSGYRGQSSQPSLTYPPLFRRPSRTQPSQEYLNSYRTPLQTLERATLGGLDSPSDSDTDASELPDSPNQNTDVTTEFRVSMEYDERPDSNDHDISGEDSSVSQSSAMASLERMATAYPMEDDFLCSDTEDSSSEDDDASESNSFNARRRQLQRQVRNMRRQYAMEQSELQRSRHTPNSVPPSAPSAPRPGQSTHPSNLGLMKPLAQFFIKRPKSSVSLKFDPPPSGRYILIKLWSPFNAGNIDIQSVVAHGFAGPRFFPASGVR
ncbi:hypothetical protein BJX61DRAFT_342779 [Aspergillus egyptiacus]|nr:hypothetical protein BJX61DRAFT_342779 [Aspergillus egyptiacus]